MNTFKSMTSMITEDRRYTVRIVLFVVTATLLLTSFVGNFLDPSFLEYAPELSGPRGTYTTISYAPAYNDRGMLDGHTYLEVALTGNMKIVGFEAYGEFYPCSGSGNGRWVRLDLLHSFRITKLLTFLHVLTFLTFVYLCYRMYKDLTGSDTKTDPKPSKFVDPDAGWLELYHELYR